VGERYAEGEGVSTGAVRKAIRSAVEKVATYVATLPTERRVVAIGEHGPNTDQSPDSEATATTSTKSDQAVARKDWRKRVGIEPTAPGVNPGPCGFEGRAGHQTRIASSFAIPSFSQNNMLCLSLS
jgi:hypothetical protein